jgi:hypothetical protein
MFFLIELGVALKVTAQILARRQFWTALAKAAMSPPFLLVLAGLVAVYATVDVPRLLLIGHEVPLAALACAWLLLPPVLMHAWCPPIARAVNAIMQLGLPERRQYKLWLFIVVWLGLVLVQGMASFAALSFSRDVALWGILVPGVLLFGAYMQRAALGSHAGLKTSRALFRATFVRRSLLWVPLIAMALFCSAWIGSGLKRGVLASSEISAMSRMADVALIVLHLPVFAALLTFWAALVLPALAQHLGPRNVQPVERPANAKLPSLPSYSGPGWKATLLGALLLALPAAYLSRLRLLDLYFMWAEPYYADSHPYLSIYSFKERMGQVLKDLACRGNQYRIEQLYKAGLDVDATPALSCAALKHNLEMAEYLIGHGANPGGLQNTVTDERPLALAVRRGDHEMVELLLRHHAQPNPAPSSPWRKSSDSSLLGMAAHRTDVTMIRTLLQAGAQSYEDERQPAFVFVEMSQERVERKSGDWRKVIGAIEESGLSLKAPDNDGSSLLHWAASHGQFELISLLLERGLDPLQRDRHGDAAFLRLARWYLNAAVEPGPEMEQAFAVLSEGVGDLNATTGTDSGLPNLASIAAARRRVRLAFAGRVDYATLGGQAATQKWPLSDRQHAIELLADLRPAELAKAPALAGALREQGWSDLAQAVERKR